MESYGWTIYAGEMIACYPNFFIQKIYLDAILHLLFSWYSWFSELSSWKYDVWRCSMVSWFNCSRFLLYPTSIHRSYHVYHHGSMHNLNHWRLCLIALAWYWNRYAYSKFRNRWSKCITCYSICVIIFYDSFYIRKIFFSFLLI